VVSNRHCCRAKTRVMSFRGECQKEQKSKIDANKAKGSDAMRD
jgi:hypothetical protein